MSIEQAMMTECMGFYRVFVDLEQKAYYGTEPQSIEDVFDTELYKTPMVVNGAFAAEIGLKLLLRQKGLSFTRSEGHELHTLYGKLDREDQTGIMCELKKTFSAHDEYNYVAAFRLFSKNFEKWRYRYEFDENFGRKHEKNPADNLIYCDDVFRAFVRAVCTYVIGSNTISKLMSIE